MRFLAARAIWINDKPLWWLVGKPRRIGGSFIPTGALWHFLSGCLNDFHEHYRPEEWHLTKGGYWARG